MCVVCVLSSPFFWTSYLWTYGRGHTGGRSHRISLPSFCGACLIFLARRIQPLLSLVDREVEFCVLHELIVLHLLLGIFFFVSRHRDSNSRPNTRRFRGLTYQVNHRGNRCNLFVVVCRDCFFCSFFCVFLCVSFLFVCLLCISSFVVCLLSLLFSSDHVPGFVYSLVPSIL